MKRSRLFRILLAFAFMLILVLPGNVQAAGNRVVDNADLLSDSEEASLASKLDAIASKYGVDVVVYTDDHLDGSPEAMASEFYDHGGYSKDGVVLMINMQERDRVLSATGFAEEAFNEDAINKLWKDITNDLKEGNYAKAFDKYADLSEDFIKRAKNGKPYKKPFKLVTDLIISVLAGLGIGTVRAGSLKSQTQTVKKATKASSYLQGTVMLTAQNEAFRGSRVAPVVRSSGGSSTGSYTSSTGAHHTTSSGKF